MVVAENDTISGGLNAYREVKVTFIMLTPDRAVHTKLKPP